MRNHPASFRLGFLAAAFLLAAGLAAFPASAQDATTTEKKPEEVSKVASVEVTPAESTIPIGGKIQFKAVAKDANGQPLPDVVKFWFAAPFDAATVNERGEGVFVQPGEITV